MNQKNIIHWIIIIGAIFIIIYQSYSFSITRESFTEWSPKLKTDFINFEKKNNPSFNFNINIIQNQASPEEVNYLLANNKWQWSEQVKNMYKNAIQKKSSIKINPDIALNEAQTIYNETAIKELLSWNTKEGEFLLNGVIVGHTKKLPKNMNNIVRCGIDEMNNDNSVMQKTTNIGYDGINGNIIQNVTNVTNSDIPNLVPGFSFLQSQCNPCVVLNDTPDYSCPFSINVGDGSKVSTIWEKLWGLQENSN